ncbi:MAG TPA: APC family permease [Thermoanaerobaculia bacterium]|nr:APC family permease [Thermoanaerobaculia bacterium]
MTAGLRRDLGTLESYATLLGILIGAGIFKVTGEAFLLTGPSVILGYVVLAPAVLATSAAYSVFLSTPLGREPGGEYTNISRTFGSYGLAFIGAWLKIISYTGALAYLARAFADYAQTLVRVDPTVLAVASLLFFYAIHVAGVRWFGRLQVWMCMLLGVSLVVLIVPGLFAIQPSYYTPFFTHGLGGFTASLPPLFFAYAGFESLAQTAGEVSDSTRRLPRVFMRGITVTLVIFFLMSLVGLGTLPPARVGISTAPMAEAAGTYLPVGAAAIVTIGALMALLTSVNATMLVPSRIAIVLAEDRLAPRWIGAVSTRTGTPIAGLTFTLAGALALLLTDRIGLALNVAVYALVLLYLLHSLALLLLPRMNPALFAQVTLTMPLTLQRVLAVVSILCMAALLSQIPFSAVKLLLFWSAIGMLLYLWSRRVANRRTAGGVEHAEETKLS